MNVGCLCSLVLLALAFPAKDVVKPLIYFYMALKVSFKDVELDLL